MNKAQLEDAVKAQQQRADELEAALLETRETLTRVARARDEAETKLAKIDPVSERQSFVPRTQPVNGFIVKITGPKRFEDEIWIEAIGDTVVILTGKKAAARWAGDESVVVRAAAPRLASFSQDAPQGGEQGQYFGPPTLPIGLGPGSRMSEEDSTKLLAGDLSVLGQLEDIATQIAHGNTNPIVS